MAQETKAQVRARVRAGRAARVPDERARAAQAIAAHAAGLLPDAPATITCYLSLPAEPGTGSLLAAAHAAGLGVLVPRVVGDRLEWVPWAPDAPTTPGPFGIDEPTAAGVPDGLRRASVLFVPALAVDRVGHRLGQGGGFYDRALASLPRHRDGGPLRVAVVFDDEVCDALPYEPHDLAVDLALTPSGPTPLDPRPQRHTGAVSSGDS